MSLSAAGKQNVGIVVLNHKSISTWLRRVRALQQRKFVASFFYSVLKNRERLVSVLRPGSIKLEIGQSGLHNINQGLQQR
jgi:hypothetical protein